MTIHTVAEVGTGTEPPTFRCQYAACGAMFTRPPERIDPVNPPLYCSSSHKRKAQQQRTEERRRVGAQALTMVGRCPRADKRLFRDITQAWKFIRNRFPDEPGMFAYVCGCGGVHIGHRADWDHSWASVREAPPCERPETGANEPAAKYIARGICEHCGETFEKGLPVVPSDLPKFCTARCRNNHGVRARRRRRALQRAQSVS